MASLLTLAQRCRPIELLILDVDGVLTPGGIVYGDTGFELKAFHVRDGSGLKLWRLAGKQVAIITGRQSPVVDVRAAELGIELVHQGRADKGAACREIVASQKLQPEQVCAIGDDVPDLPVLRECGLAVAVADACVDVLTSAHYITKAAGGRGAVRETSELILRCQGHWQRLVDRKPDEAAAGS
ncbi:MAG TPA: HAD hydrolase family protein [Gemmataceae bacterium]|nr:HAD hydrolase family protein [Gemmataceae bacterium]